MRYVAEPWNAEAVVEKGMVADEEASRISVSSVSLALKAGRLTYAQPGIRMNSDLLECLNTSLVEIQNLTLRWVEEHR